MMAFTRALVVLALMLVPLKALAHRSARAVRGAVAPADDALADMAAESTAAPVLAPGRGARMHRAPIDPGVTSIDLRTALLATRGDLEQCLAAAGITGTLHVTARIAISHSLDLDITTPHAEPGSRACAELVLRRALTGIAGRPIARAVRASLGVRRRAPRVPAPPSPRPDVAAFEGPVHAAIDHDRVAMLQCLSSAAPGVAGNASLRVTLAPDGTLSLTSASLPPGVPAGPALPCLSARIAQLRFAPAPPSAIAIEHSLPLGL